MAKYYYSVDEDICADIYKENAKRDLFADGYYPLAMTLVVEAESEEHSRQIRIAATDIRMWKLDKYEE